MYNYVEYEESIYIGMGSIVKSMDTSRLTYQLSMLLTPKMYLLLS